MKMKRVLTNLIIRMKWGQRGTLLKLLTFAKIEVRYRPNHNKKNLMEKAQRKMKSKNVES